mmetsp:Transcript_20956/g.37935  ORF Transcript_20956/g.37935 Transcript_20956/m.37935 type:complete len:297 (+) Transcript_20956:593-1483(+)
MQQQMQQEMQQQQQQASAQQSLAEDDAALELDRVAGRMDQFRAEAVDGELGQDANKRMEAFGFLIADLLQLDFETATEVFHTTSAAARFAVLLSFLEPLRSELAAMKSLDSIGLSSPPYSPSPGGGGGAGDSEVASAGSSDSAIDDAINGLEGIGGSGSSGNFGAAGGATRGAVGGVGGSVGSGNANRIADVVSGKAAPAEGGGGAAAAAAAKESRRNGSGSGSEIGLQTGMRIEYWYNEEWGWCSGKLVYEERMTLAGETVSLWTFKYDSDGSEEGLRLTLENKPRWRLLRSSGN